MYNYIQQPIYRRDQIPVPYVEDIKKKNKKFCGGVPAHSKGLPN